MANLDRNIWEGWTPRDFIRELEPQLDYIMGVNSQYIEEPRYKTKDEIKKWCIDNQPYYKKYIPEVVTYFWAKYKPYIEHYKKYWEC